MKILSLLQMILLYMGILVITVECNLGKQIAKLLHDSKIPLERAVTKRQLVEHCGESNYNSSTTKNGDAGRNEFPWQALIQINKYGTFQHYCNGAIIHERFIMTAAFCVLYSEKQLRIAAGLYDLSEPNSVNSQYRNIKKTYIIPNSETKSHNMGILELAKPLEMQSGIISSICIPTGDEDFSDEVSAAGWEMKNKNFNQILQKMQLNNNNFTTCDKKYEDQGYDAMLYQCQLCLTTPNYEETCEANYMGSSIMCVDEKSNKTFACGIMYWGAGCVEEGLPMIASDTSCDHYISWADNIIGES